MERLAKRVDVGKEAFFLKGSNHVVLGMSSIPIYYISLFKRYVGVATSLDRIMNRFLWALAKGGTRGSPCCLESDFSPSAREFRSGGILCQKSFPFL